MARLIPKEEAIVSLELTRQEAMWLGGVMQNPLQGELQPQEDPDTERMRKNIWQYLYVQCAARRGTADPITLHLHPIDARLLRSLMQNPLYGVDPGDECPGNEQYRHAIFEALPSPHA